MDLKELLEVLIGLALGLVAALPIVKVKITQLKKLRAEIGDVLDKIESASAEDSAGGKTWTEAERKGVMKEIKEAVAAGKTLIGIKK